MNTAPSSRVEEPKRDQLTAETALRQYAASKKFWDAEAARPHVPDLEELLTERSKRLQRPDWEAKLLSSIERHDSQAVFRIISMGQPVSRKTAESALLVAARERAFEDAAELLRTIVRRETGQDVTPEYPIDVLHRLELRKKRALAAGLRDTRVRTFLIRRLESLPLPDQFAELARDKRYPVEFYPTRLAGKGQTETLRNLDPHVRSLLLEKLKGGHRGPWASFKRRLLRVVAVEAQNRSGR